MQNALALPVVLALHQLTARQSAPQRTFAPPVTLGGTRAPTAKLAQVGWPQLVFFAGV